MAFISKEGGFYYEGDPMDPADLVVPPRPHPLAIWDGSTWTPDRPPVPEPVVHIAWLRAALAESGELVAVDRAAAAAGTVNKQLWDYATTIRRNHPAVVAIGAALHLNLDQLFERAEALRKANS